jgi:hypothetical protein
MYFRNRNFFQQFTAYLEMLLRNYIAALPHQLRTKKVEDFAPTVSKRRIPPMGTEPKSFKREEEIFTTRLMRKSLPAVNLDCSKG